MNKTLNKLLLSFGTVAAVAAPVVVAVSCGSEGTTTTGGMTSATFATVQGDTDNTIKGTMLFSPTNPNGVEGVKNIRIQNSAFISPTDTIVAQAFAEDIVVDMSSNGTDEFTMDELESALLDINVKVNEWISQQLLLAFPTTTPTSLELEQFNLSFRYKWELNSADESLSINFYKIANSSEELDLFIDKFMDETNGIKQVPMDQLTINDGFQYFMGVRPLTYQYLHEGFHLDANFANEEEFLQKLDGHKFTSYDELPNNVSVHEGKFPNIEEIVTFGPDKDIFVIVQPHLDPDTDHEFYVNFEFYKGGQLTKVGNDGSEDSDGFRSMVVGAEAKTTRTIMLEGAYPKDYTADVSNWATDEAKFRSTLKATEALTVESTMNMMNLVKSQMPEYTAAIDALREAGNLMRETNLYDNDDFVRGLYESTVTDPDISLVEYMKFGDGYHFDPRSIITAPGNIVKQLVVHVLMVYENRDFIVEWNQQHPAPEVQVHDTRLGHRSEMITVHRWPNKP